MLEGLRTAAAGMPAQQQKLDAVANDLANANTTGYKRLRVGFSRPPVRARPAAPTAQRAQLGTGVARRRQRPRRSSRARLQQTGAAARRRASRARASCRSSSPTAARR